MTSLQAASAEILPVEQPGEQTVSICICTSGRPSELKRCLSSINAGTRLPFEVVVSDDSASDVASSQVRSVCGEFKYVRYVQGPIRGLCANRNAAVRECRGSHISLLDDDAVVGPDFVAKAIDAVDRFPGRIISGDVLEDGLYRSSPTNPKFLGHFGRVVREGDQLANINLNCNVFPRGAFESALFDELITYGYEDTDLCAQLLAQGFRIVHVPELVNQHLPPTRAKVTDDRHWQAERARFYTTIRRHGRWKPNRLSLTAFALIAPLHLAVHSIKQGQLHNVFKGWNWVIEDLRWTSA